jgi:uroporphyrin-III C-methyltransferase/precorrin-2 dehydrogenase/sirohydrochlorin ferrochelatase
LRLRLEGLLPASLGNLAEGLKAARTSLRQTFPEPAARRRALDAALAEGGALDPLRDHPAGAVALWLDGAAPGESGTAEFSVTSDDPDALTLRQARLLGAADLVAYEAGVAPAILARARADAARQELAGGEHPAPRPGLAVIIRRG